MHKIAFVIHQTKGITMKHLKVLIAATAVALALNATFAGAVTAGIPKGWTGQGKIAERYETGIDPTQGTADHPAFFMAAKADASEEDFAAITQVIDASPYRGKALNFKVKIRYIGESSVCEAWIRTTSGSVPHLSTGIYGTGYASKNGDWQDMIVSVAMVPENANTIELGVGLRAQGRVWIRDIVLDQAALPVSKRPRMEMAKSIPLSVTNAVPLNLNFSE